ncbi:Cytosol aminopeptidase [Delftia tsuruhatensis]|uniref:leucyl aminopeptidase n=1 Tax=Delftia tsuruhatensis TaxID=180282 RepID=UPI001E7548F7|nr:leucyl aminopeptidase [Delftia tsuruhatensis]CAB5673576.1 Cytosol aminopeptidase [Delftia tsuruhatensis]CAC9683676.1 Cytosol aminopeptidase [Delftia tsuruhatensis]
MNFELKPLTTAAAVREKCDLLLVLVTEATATGSDALSTLVAHAVKAGDFEVAAGKQLALYGLPAVAARRVVLLGAGSGSARDVRQAVAGAGACLKASGVGKALLCFGFEPAGAAVAAAVLAAADACYSYTHTKPQAKPVALKKLVIGAGGKTGAKNGIAASFRTAVAQAEGMSLAREWANRPANHATPTLLADAARSLAKLPGISCKIHGPAEVARLGMGAFLAVAQGSAQPLRFIELHYNGGAKGDAPIVLVGKGITFDTGGISLKPAAEMDEMKFDMGGAASVLGVFQSLGQLQPAINVVGLIPACENMPGGSAVKPGDVVTSMSGQTIEILNTDAEGRLVLSDALTYAARFKPRAMVDIATLTGACVIALGGLRSGMFSASDELARALEQAGDAALDPCWRMPLDEEYGEGLKSNFADMGNVAGRAAGAVTAAKFLQRFVGDIPWAHLDIAGTAWKSGAAKGGTGRPVGLLLHFLLSSALAGKPQAKAATPGKATASRGAKPAKVTKVRKITTTTGPEQV